MPTKISDRLLGLWDRSTSTISTAIEANPRSQDHHQEDQQQDSPTDEKKNSFQEIISPVCRNNPSAVLGLVRLSTWNLHSQTAFADFATKVVAGDQRKVLAVSPWNSTAPILNQRKRNSSVSFSEQKNHSLSDNKSLTEIVGQPRYSTDYHYVSLEAASDRVEPSVISQLLRDLSSWKKSYDIVLLDLGIVGQPVSQSLANWCDAIYLISNDADHKRYAMAGRQIDHWTTSGFRLDAAIHVA